MGKGEFLTGKYIFFVKFYIMFFFFFFFFFEENGD
jgi:hypothetical protein